MWKKFYMLTSQDFKTTYKAMLAIVLGMLILQLTLLGITAEELNSGYIPFEILIEKSGCSAIFGIAVMFTLGIGISMWFLNYFRSKSIYTLMTLPIDRSFIYFSKLVVVGIYFLMIIAAQLLSFIIGYLLFHIPLSYEYTLVYAEIPYVELTKCYATNGLFLTLVRSSFLRLAIPFSSSLLGLNLVMFLSLVISSFYGTLSMWSYRVPRWLLPIGINTLMIILIIVARLEEPVRGIVWWQVIGLLCTTTWNLFFSLKLLKKGANA